MMHDNVEVLQYRVIDGKRVPIAKKITETRYGRTFDRLDAPYGYKKSVVRDKVKEGCTVFVVQGASGAKERYATVSRPASDPLVAFRCFRLTRD